MNLMNDIIAAFAGVDHLRFIEPVFIGDTLTVSKRVLERRELGAGQGMLIFETRVFNQNGRTVLAYVDKLLVTRPVVIAKDCATAV
jgi:acyl dehydratase